MKSSFAPSSSSSSSSSSPSLKSTSFSGQHMRPLSSAVRREPQERREVRALPQVLQRALEDLPVQGGLQPHPQLPRPPHKRGECQLLLLMSSVLTVMIDDALTFVHSTLFYLSVTSLVMSSYIITLVVFVNYIILHYIILYYNMVSI